VDTGLGRFEGNLSSILSSSTFCQGCRQALPRLLLDLTLPQYLHSGGSQGKNGIPCVCVSAFRFPCPLIKGLEDALFGRGGVQGSRSRSTSTAIPSSGETVSSLILRVKMSSKTSQPEDRTSTLGKVASSHSHSALVKFQSPLTKPEPLVSVMAAHARLRMISHR
jgi:hypothetical protein